MLAALLLLADAPKDAYRVAVEAMPLPVSMIDAAACATRELNRMGRATQIQTDGGITVDWAITAPFSGSAGPAYISLQFKDQPASVTVLYRHPISARAAQKTAETMGKKCWAAQ